VAEAKPFDISKRDVWEAFKGVKANRGAAGVDGQSIADFEADLGGSAWITPSVNKTVRSSFGLVYLQSHDRQRSAPSRSTPPLCQWG